METEYILIEKDKYINYNFKLFTWFYNLKINEKITPGQEEELVELKSIKDSKNEEKSNAYIDKLSAQSVLQDAETDKQQALNRMNQAETVKAEASNQLNQAEIDKAEALNQMNQAETDKAEALNQMNQAETDKEEALNQKNLLYDLKESKRLLYENYDQNSPEYLEYQSALQEYETALQTYQSFSDGYETVLENYNISLINFQLKQDEYNTSVQNFELKQTEYNYLVDYLIVVTEFYTETCNVYDDMIEVYNEKCTIYNEKENLYNISSSVYQEKLELYDSALSDYNICYNNLNEGYLNNYKNTIKQYILDNISVKITKLGPNIILSDIERIDFTAISNLSELTVEDFDFSSNEEHVNVYIFANNQKISHYSFYLMARYFEPQLSSNTIISDWLMDHMDFKLINGGGYLYVELKNISGLSAPDEEDLESISVPVSSSFLGNITNGIQFVNFGPFTSIGILSSLFLVRDKILLLKTGLTTLSTTVGGIYTNLIATIAKVNKLVSNMNKIKDAYPDLNLEPI